MDFLLPLKLDFQHIAKSHFGVDLSIDEITLNETRKEFDGDYTIVLFPFLKKFGMPLESLGDEIGRHFIALQGNVTAFNVVKGFLNLTLSDLFWKTVSDNLYGVDPLISFQHKPEKVLVEFASPNTNKPLHLGHIRNILLGWSISKIYAANGYDVIKTQIINDRGIAICKSMYAWQKWGEGTTPESTGIKGDHFVGDFYVLFEKKFQEEYKLWQNTLQATEIFEAQTKFTEPIEFFKSYKNQYFNLYSNIGNDARNMLLAWEAEDEKTKALWHRMNQWVYEGFDETLFRLGVAFDTTYYESDTYLLGKKAVETGLRRGVFNREEDNSVWIDLTDVGMDKKIILRSDGTSVYITQDIGTAQQRYEDFNVTKMIYTVGDEQDYHFKVLFEILKRLGEPFAEGLYHLSYGMMELPTGKMKSREGTVVDADDIIAEVINEAAAMTAERGEISHLPDEEKNEIIRKIGMAALKFFIIKVSPKKKMIFDPKDSVDLQGQTGPYIQNAYVRIQSLLRKANDLGIDLDKYQFTSDFKINEFERALLKQILNFPMIIKTSAESYDPSLIANFSYQLAKDFHRFYHDVRILNGESTDIIAFRLRLAQTVGLTLWYAFDLLGIEMPDKM
ncbi:MAG: arginine--tRNA ligase [Saprospiraceae bacterium]